MFSHGFRWQIVWTSDDAEEQELELDQSPRGRSRTDGCLDERSKNGISTGPKKTCMVNSSDL